MSKFWRLKGVVLASAQLWWELYGVIGESFMGARDQIK
jgi:hypothetical protein